MTDLASFLDNEKAKNEELEERLNGHEQECANRYAAIQEMLESHGEQLKEIAEQAEANTAFKQMVTSWVFKGLVGVCLCALGTIVAMGVWVISLLADGRIQP
jgi:hypothetical protein